MRTLIVDHEPQGRAMLRHLCEADTSIEEVAVAECGAAAIELIHTDRPDLLLLDVELNDMTGFDVLRSLNPARPLAVIMVAAHDEHEVEAFRGGAIDYLTKPIGARRFASAIAKAHDRIHLAFPRAQRSVAMAAHSRRGLSPLRLVAENSHRVYFLPVEEVDYIESCGNYVLIHVGEQKYVRRDMLKRLAVELRDAEFEWIRRTILINLARVAFAEKLGRGALAFTLTSGTRLVSRRRLRLNGVCAEDYDG